MRPRAALLLAVLPFVAGRSEVTGGRVLCRKLEPPIQVTLRALGATAGELRVLVEVRPEAALTDLRMIVRLQDAAHATSREESRALDIPLGQTLREELALRDAPESGTLLVGVEGRQGNAVFHRSAALDIGTPPARELQGTTRIDADGRSYFEVRMPPPSEEPR